MNSVCGHATASLVRASIRLARVYREEGQHALARAFLADAARYRREIYG